MKREWNLLRLLLEKVEGDALDGYLQQLEEEKQAANYLPENERTAKLAECSGREKNVYGHLMLMADSQLIDGFSVRFVPSSGSYKCMTDGLPRLTMKGHDTLDALRSNKVWNEIQRRSKEQLIPVTLELILAVLKSLALSA